jgi:16S rRNA (cytidine1402-2'-O)-methyltransferase
LSTWRACGIGASYGRAVIILAGTPLGNPQDASDRLRHLLETADVVAAEDTRRVRRLAADLEVTIQGRVVSYFDGNERARTDELIKAAQNGANVLVLTDAGMPTVSDPGYRIVRAAIDQDVPLTCVPGPSAVLTALAISGLPTDRFSFEGFLPRKPGERARALAQLRTSDRTMVFFEAPHRLLDSLSAMVDAFGADRAIAVCRELTKTYEEVVRGSLADAVTWAANGVLGEVTLVLAGADAAGRRRELGLVDEADWVAAVHDAVAEGVDQRTAISDVAEAAQVGRRAVYEAVIKAKREP